MNCKDCTNTDGEICSLCGGKGSYEDSYENDKLEKEQACHWGKTLDEKIITQRGRF